MGLEQLAQAGIDAVLCQGPDPAGVTRACWPLQVRKPPFLCGKEKAMAALGRAEHGPVSMLGGITAHTHSTCYLLEWASELSKANRMCVTCKANL